MAVRMLIAAKSPGKLSTWSDHAATQQVAANSDSTVSSSTDFSISTPKMRQAAPGGTLHIVGLSLFRFYANCDSGQPTNRAGRHTFSVPGQFVTSVVTQQPGRTQR